MNIGVALGLIVLGSCLWVLVCHEITSRQRRRILDAIYIGHPRFWRLHSLLDLVSYEQHLFALLTFRSPWNLYDSEIRALVPSKVKETA